MLYPTKKHPEKTADIAWKGHNKQQKVNNRIIMWAIKLAKGYWATEKEQKNIMLRIDTRSAQLNLVGDWEKRNKTQMGLDIGS